MQPGILPSCRRSPAVTTEPAGRLLNAPAQVVQQVDPDDRAGEPVAVRYPARLPTDSPAWATAGAIRSAGASRRQCRHPPAGPRSEEHTSELQSLMRISYAVFSLTTKN